MLHGPCHLPVALRALCRVLAVRVAPEAADHLAFVLARAGARHRATVPIAIVQVGLEVGEARLVRQPRVPLRARIDGIILRKDRVVVAHITGHCVVARALAEKLPLALRLPRAAPQVHIGTAVNGRTRDAQEAADLHVLHGICRAVTVAHGEDVPLALRKVGGVPHENIGTVAAGLHNGRAEVHATLSVLQGVSSAGTAKVPLAV
eukprot:CAMPEP_0115672602 /NCGR_PEP_ID=MMETSP0272-20121206/52669_1 /TAXON_ID=71861 /ORGANISM="Scrippsiella trochoidea, Strain CCMP3099" /LENGTH=204 /DNA_ID=CAMNT_0003111443 /DNA_START=257 /DNA_END=871 /DNA_ORIENTATION=+